jgi:hypothetical protein
MRSVSEVGRLPSPRGYVEAHPFAVEINRP